MTQLYPSVAVCTEHFDASLLSFYWKAQCRLSHRGGDRVQQAEPGMLVCPRHTPWEASLSSGLGCVEEGGTSWGPGCMLGADSAKQPTGPCGTDLH